jgi:hypothetical protein
MPISIPTLADPVRVDPAEPAEPSPGRAVKEAQTARAAEVQTPAFLDRFVRPHLPATAGPGRWETEVIQLDGSGAATVRVSLDGCAPVFAKLFPGEDGPSVHRKLVAFQEVGFDPSQRYRTVEPLAWYHDEKLLLCRGASGRCLDELFDEGEEAWRAGVAEAGAWLGRFHSSGLSIGTPKSLIVTSELLSLGKRLAKAVVAHPEYLEAGLDKIAWLDRLSRTTRDVVPVQSHGQYRPIHVFLDPAADGASAPAVTVIDLDRSAPADPGRDVAEFLHRMHTDSFQRTGRPEPAEYATRDFLHAYAAAAGGEAFLANVAFHRARYITHSLSRLVKKGLMDDPEFDFWNEQFSHVVSGRAGR